MDSSHHSNFSPKSSLHWPAQAMGTAIALLTLILPLLAIAYVSTQTQDPWQEEAYPTTAPLPNRVTSYSP